MFNPGSYDNARSRGVPVLEIQTGKEPGAERKSMFVPLRRTELRGEVSGPLASLRLTQTFEFSRAQCAGTLEAVYRFPLPGDAAVTGVTVRFGEVEIRAELKPRSEAEAGYAEAREQARQALLLRRESPDVFSLGVSGIQPDQPITVETSYVQLARSEGGGWSLRVPLTTAPRYVRGDERAARHAAGQPLALLRDPGHRFAVDLLFRGAGPVVSDTHPLEVVAEDGGARVRLRGGEVVPDRDYVIAWEPERQGPGVPLRVFLHEDAKGETHFLALACPPVGDGSGRGVYREVILLVDHSGSMAGAKWEAADWAVKKFLSELGSEDVLALGVFHDTTTWLAREPQRADSSLLEKAARFLEEQRDSGGTELGVALEQALALKRAKGRYVRHVLIVTDAEVSDAGRILRLADEEAVEKERRRISVLCIDAAPNAFLAGQLAEHGGGLARFLTSAPEEEDITTALEEVLLDWSRPAVADLELEVRSPEVVAAGRAVGPGREPGWVAVDLGDLPAGRPVWVAGRAPGVMRATDFRLTAGGLEGGAERGLGTVLESEGGPAVKALFGAWRVLGLEFLIHSGREGQEIAAQLARLGYDAREVLPKEGGVRRKVYAETVRAAAIQALKGLLVSEALDYGLVSSETSFLAVRREKGRTVEGTVMVANALPAGWSGRLLSSGLAKAFPAAPVAMRAMSIADVAPGSAGAGTGAMAEASATRAAGTVLFAGRPRFVGTDARLFDSAEPGSGAQLPEETTFTRLRLRLGGGQPAVAGVPADLLLMLFVDDLAAPRARVRVVDVLRQGGVRPLNVLRRAGQRVQLVLRDLTGGWSSGAPEIQVSLEW